jgi:hypothetical protein
MQIVKEYIKTWHSFKGKQTFEGAMNIKFVQ